MYKKKNMRSCDRTSSPQQPIRKTGQFQGEPKNVGTQLHAGTMERSLECWNAGKLQQWCSIMLITLQIIDNARIFSIFILFTINNIFSQYFLQFVSISSTCHHLVLIMM
jgi:hypothetical protein